MSWSVLVKVAIAAVFLTIAAGTLTTALLMAGVPVRIARALILLAGVVAAAVVAGMQAVRALGRDADLLRARATGVGIVATAGALIGLLSTLDASVGLAVGVGAAAAGWVGARVATRSSRRSGAEGRH